MLFLGLFTILLFPVKKKQMHLTTEHSYVRTTLGEVRKDSVGLLASVTTFQRGSKLTVWSVLSAHLFPAFAGSCQVVVDLPQLSEACPLHLQLLLQFEGPHLALHLQTLGLGKRHVGVVHLLTLTEKKGEVIAEY